MEINWSEGNDVQETNENNKKTPLDNLAKACIGFSFASLIIVGTILFTLKNNNKNIELEAECKLTQEEVKGLTNHILNNWNKSAPELLTEIKKEVDSLCKKHNQTSPKK